MEKKPVDELPITVLQLLFSPHIDYHLIIQMLLILFANIFVPTCTFEESISSYKRTKTYL